MPSPVARFTVALLDTKLHDRGAFDCGEPSLDAYLKRQAGQDLERRVATTYVLAPQDVPSRVAGYFTLSAFAVLLTEIPDDLARRLPHYDRIAATLIGRLARDVAFRGAGIGELLLLDALSRAFAASDHVASHAVVVDAIDERATSFYRRYGFLPLPDDGRRLFVPMSTVANLLRV